MGITNYLFIVYTHRMKVADGYCPLPNARLSHLRKPRATNVHGKSLYLCQYTGELSPKCYGVSIYGVRQGSFKDMACLLTFLVCVINNQKSEEKEKKDAHSLYDEIVKKFSMEQKPILAPDPHQLTRFGGTLNALDDRYQYAWPDMTESNEKAYLFDPVLHDENADEKPSPSPKFEIQIPLDFAGNSFIVDHREASLRTLRTQLSEFIASHAGEIDKSCVSFKHMQNSDEEQFALNFMNGSGKTADFVVRPYQPMKTKTPPRKPRAVKQKTNFKEEKKERTKKLKKYDKELSKTIVSDILNDRKLLEPTS
jgi:hypothetical protein